MKLELSQVAILEVAAARTATMSAMVMAKVGIANDDDSDDDDDDDDDLVYTNDRSSSLLQPNIKTLIMMINPPIL